MNRRKTFLSAKILLGLSTLPVPGTAADRQVNPEALLAALVRAAGSAEMRAADPGGNGGSPLDGMDLADILASALGADTTLPDDKDYVMSVAYYADCGAGDGGADSLACQLTINTRDLDPEADFESSVIFDFAVTFDAEGRPRVAGPVRVALAG